MLTRKTQRLIVRPLELSDFDAWQVSFSTMRPQQNKWDQQNRPKSELTKLNFKEILKSQKDLRERDQFYDLAVFEKKSGELIGNVAAMDVLRGLGQSAYLGYSCIIATGAKDMGKRRLLP